MAEKTVTVEALQDHSSDGIPRPQGSQYELDEAVLAYLIDAGLVRPVTAAPAVAADGPPAASPKPAARKK